MTYEVKLLKEAVASGLEEQTFRNCVARWPRRGSGMRVIIVRVSFYTLRRFNKIRLSVGLALRPGGINPKSRSPWDISPRKLYHAEPRPRKPNSNFIHNQPNIASPLRMRRARVFTALAETAGPARCRSGANLHRPSHGPRASPIERRFHTGRRPAQVEV